MSGRSAPYGVDQALLEGTQIDEATAEALERLLVEAPDTTAARLHIIGYYFARSDLLSMRHRIEHVLFMVEHHPEIALNAFGAIPQDLFPLEFAEATRRWMAQLNRNFDLIIAKNAALFLQVDAPNDARSILDRAIGVAPLDLGLRLDRASSFRLDVSLHAPDARRQELESRALADLQRAYLLAEDDVRRLEIATEIADCALYAEDPDTASVAARTVIARAAGVPQGRTIATCRQRSHIVLGLLAADAQQFDEAILRLAASAEWPPSAGSITEVDLRLATRVLAAAHSQAVADYLRSLARAAGSYATALQELADGVAAGLVTALPERFPH